MNKKINKKQFLLLFLFFLSLGLLLPRCNSIVNGAITYDISEGLSLGFDIWGGLFKIINTITRAFLDISFSLLKWVTSDHFIAEKFTQNDFVTPAWEMMKNIANIIVVLGLIIIALATILRRQEYQVQKTLPWLLIAALLINFSPVICGVFIDASNIVMNYFSKMGTLGTGIIDAVPNWNPGGEQASQQGAVIFTFNIIAGIIFLLYTLLFLARYIALWMLVIISPIAFVCFALPFAKKVWALWWNQFFQWCIIGIPAFFSIYITNKMIILLGEGKLVGAATGEIAKEGYSFLIYLVPLGFLVGGFFISLQTGAIGADLITQKAKQAGIFAGRKAGKGVKWAAKQTDDRLKIRERIRKAEATIGKRMKKIKIPLVPTMGRALTAGVSEKDSDEIKKTEKEMSGKTLDAKEKILRGINKNERIGTLRASIKDKDINDLIETKAIRNREIKKTMKETIETNPSFFKDMKDAFPKLAEEIGNEMNKEINELRGRGRDKAAEAQEQRQKIGGIDFDEKDRKDYITLSEKIMATIKPSKMENWSRQTMEEALNSETVHKFWTGAHMSEAAKNFGREFLKNWKLQAATEDYYEKKKKNLALAKYIRSTAGQTIGIDFGTRATPGGALPTTTTPTEEQRRPFRKKGPPPETGEEGAKKRKESDVGEK